MATHADKNLNSQDNITVMIILVVGASAPTERVAARNARSASFLAQNGDNMLGANLMDLSASKSSLLRRSGVGSNSSTGSGSSLSARLGAAAFKGKYAGPACCLLIFGDGH
jgi:hypothetical protein